MQERLRAAGEAVGCRRSCGPQERLQAVEGVVGCRRDCGLQGRHRQRGFDLRVYKMYGWSFFLPDAADGFRTCEKEGKSVVWAGEREIP